MAEKIHLPILGLVSSFGVALSFFACALASITAGARVLFSMARDGNFWPAGAAVHPRNATPFHTIALYSLFGLASTLGFLACGIAVGPTLDYLSCIGTSGFVVAYLLVSVAAPVYLHRQGSLDRRGILEAALSVSSMIVVLVFTVYPVQPVPNRYYILVFLGFLATGFAISQLKPWRKSARPLAESSPAAT
jgi:amino acid transporter